MDGAHGALVRQRERGRIYGLAMKSSWLYGHCSTLGYYTELNVSAGDEEKYSNTHRPPAVFYSTSCSVGESLFGNED